MKLGKFSIGVGDRFSHQGKAQLRAIMRANETGLEVGEFIHTIGDAHLYTNHMEQINLQLSRETYDLPKLVLLHPEKSIFDMNSEDIIVEDYRCHKTIKAPIAV